MDEKGLDAPLVEQWRAASVDLGISVTAPVELKDASAEPFVCEALVHDFGSPNGTVFVSRKTERRVRQHLRSLGDQLCVSGGERRQTAVYNRNHFIDTLLDFGWCGKAGAEPEWYSQRVPRSG